MKNLKDMKKKPFKDTTEGPDGEIEALTKEKNEHFPEIKKWISEQLNVNVYLLCTEFLS